MEQDFAADTFSVSEESEDDDNEDSRDGPLLQQGKLQFLIGTARHESDYNNILLVPVCNNGNQKSIPIVAPSIINV